MSFLRGRLRFYLLKTCVITIRGHKKPTTTAAKIDTLDLDLTPEGNRFIMLRSLYTDATSPSIRNKKISLFLKYCVNCTFVESGLP